MLKSPAARIAVALLVAAGAWIAMRGVERLRDRVTSGGPGPVFTRVPRPPPPTQPAEAGLKMAFIGDSGAGATFEQVLGIIRDEGAQAVVHLGDAIYGSDTPEQFWGVIDRVLGPHYPYFLAQGNHDADKWRLLAAHGAEHGRDGAEDPLDPRFDLVFRGVSLLVLGDGAREGDPRHIIERFAHDDHVWKICAWHKNQAAMQVGGKVNEMGWGVYEACRQMGAMVMTGHEHSYQRTRTLKSTIFQQVDPACSDPARLCVRPGAIPVFVSGLGGRSIRVQRRCLPRTPPYGCNGEWAFIYTADQDARFGALIIAFDVGGDAHKAHGYFKNVEGKVVDEFDLTAQ